jgi:hypothetical protein
LHLTKENGERRLVPFQASVHRLFYFIYGQWVHLFFFRPNLVACLGNAIVVLMAVSECKHLCATSTALRFAVGCTFRDTLLDTLERLCTIKCS